METWTLKLRNSRNEVKEKGCKFLKEEGKKDKRRRKKT
jgi:hypothetical protein